jgi:hypothetical protein
MDETIFILDPIEGKFQPRLSSCTALNNLHYRRYLFKMPLGAFIYVRRHCRASSDLFCVIKDVVPDEFSAAPCGVHGHCCKVVPGIMDLVLHHHLVSPMLCAIFQDRRSLWIGGSIHTKHFPHNVPFKLLPIMCHVFAPHNVPCTM